MSWRRMTSVRAMRYRVYLESQTALESPTRTLNGEGVGARRSSSNMYLEIGRPMSELNGLTAAIAQLRSLTLVTRNEGHFDDCAIEVVNPWQVQRH